MCMRLDSMCGGEAVIMCMRLDSMSGRGAVIMCTRRQRLGGPAPQVRDPRLTDLRGADSWESRRYPAAAVYDANSLLFLMLFKGLENVNLSQVILHLLIFQKYGVEL